MKKFDEGGVALCENVVGRFLTSHYFCNGNWNDINSYIFIIYVTPNVLWIQVN
jgi:hypothetical protein